MPSNDMPQSSPPVEERLAGGLTDSVDGPALLAPSPAPDTTSTLEESPRKRARRHARRARLHIYALLTVALAAAVIALAASNTAHAKVSWVVGSSHVSLVWMVLSAVVLGWLLGLLTAAVLHRRTRGPH